MAKHVHVAIIAAFVAITCCAGCACCACANAQTVNETFKEINDTFVSRNVDADEQARFDCLASWHEARVAREAEEQAAATDAAVDNQDGAAEYYEPEYYEPVYYEPQYGGGYSNDFMSQGVVYGEDGTRFTWYSQNVLPGGGLTELNNNGRHVDERGFVCDGDGYIAVSSDDYDLGTVVDTPWGAAKVYDGGCESGTIDVYTDF